MVSHMEKDNQNRVAIICESGFRKIFTIAIWIALFLPFIVIDRGGCNNRILYECRGTDILLGNKGTLVEGQDLSKKKTGKVEDGNFNLFFLVLFLLTAGLAFTKSLLRMRDQLYAAFLASSRWMISSLACLIMLSFIDAKKFLVGFWIMFVGVTAIYLIYLIQTFGFSATRVRMSEKTT